MAHSDHLFSVIQSLSKSERRYFKMHGSLQRGGEAYLGLFQLMDSWKSDDANIRVAFEKQFPGSSYDTARKHLYKILMRSLRNYETDKTPEDQLISIVADAKTLLNRGLLEVGISEIERGKKMALKYEKFHYYLVLARMELQHLTLAEFPNIDESMLLEKQEKINNLLYEELYINKHAALYEILLHRYIHQGVMRSDRQSEKLNDLVLEEFQVNGNQRYHNFQTDRLHLHFQATYFLMTGDPRQSLHEFHKLKLLFDQNHIHWKDEPLYYIYLLNGMLANLRDVGEFNQMEHLIRQLDQLEVNSSGIQRLIQHLVYQHTMIIFIDQGKFVEAGRQASQFEKSGGLRTKVSLNVQASTQLITAISFFGNTDFRRALVHVNEVMALPETLISRHTYVVARLLLLILHLELGNEDLLAYAIKSFERKLKSNKILHQTEKITLDFLKKRISYDSANQKENELTYATRLAAFVEDKYEGPILKTFNLLAWIQSKRKSISLGEEVRSRF